MKPLFQRPGYELAWPAFWLTLLGAAITGIAISAGSYGTLLGFGLISLLLGLGVWQQVLSLVMAAVVFTSLLAVMQSRS